MAKIHYVRSARQRFERVPVLDEDGNQKTVARKRRDGTPKITRKGKPIIVRLTKDDRSQPLPNRACEKCRAEIKPGDPYKWVQPKSGPYGGAKRVRCGACPAWRPSELTYSKMAGVYAAQEQLEDDLGGCSSVEDLESLRDDVAEQVREVASEYEEGADNIEGGFGHETPTAEEMREKSEELEAWADEIESVEFDEPEEGADVEQHWEDERCNLDEIVSSCPV